MNKCPYCGVEMKRGVVTSGDCRSFLYFEFQLDRKPTLKEQLLGVWTDDNKIMLVDRYNNLKLPKIEADYCKHCNKIVIDVPDKLE